MNSPLFGKVVIVGPGLIGASLGMALRDGRLSEKVIGVGRRPESLAEARRVGAVDETTLDLQGSVGQADLVVLATGVGTIPMQMAAVAPQMKKGAVLTDVGSVKGCICQAARQVIAANPQLGVRFVGGHPLAGSEQRGATAARRDLFRGAVCVLTPTVRTDPDGKGLLAVRALWEAVGCRVRELSPEDHDRLIALSSHLPHVVAACLVNAVCDRALDLTSRGFLDTTRVASGDPMLWVDICAANRKEILAALDALTVEIRDFAKALGAGNTDALRALLEQAKQRRDGRLTTDDQRPTNDR